MTNGLDIFTQALIYSIHIILKDSSMSDQIFYLFSAVLLGLVIGALIMYFATGTKRHSEQTIAKLEKEIMKIAKQVCGNKIVSILEGGYNLAAIQESAKYHVEALLEV